MAIRAPLFRFLAAGALFWAAGCSEPEGGPVRVSAIGEPAAMVNPNLRRLDPPSAFFLEAAAQGLVQFDATGQIQPGLAQSWFVSDDGLRYTFRLARGSWADGKPVTAEQVVARLRAALSSASRNELKPMLGVIEEIEAMTGDVLEISLRSPRPNFLQLMAQPEMGLLRDLLGTGPYTPTPRADGSVLLSLHQPDEDDREHERHPPPIELRGEQAALAVARFARGDTDLVVGGDAGTLPIARAAEAGNEILRFDPASGLFGLAFAHESGFLSDPAVRNALSMAIDRDALVTALNVPDLQPRASLLPAGIDELPAPVAPDWATAALAQRRALAAQAVGTAAGELQPVIRVAMPEGPGYRLVFAHLRRDWREIGVAAVRVGAAAPADLRFIDAVAPAVLASWYLRQFTCDRGLLCSAEADELLAAARNAPTVPERHANLARADQVLSGMVVFIPLAAPVRWSLVSPRITGFQPNMFARHPPRTLLAEKP